MSNDTRKKFLDRYEPILSTGAKVSAWFLLFAVLYILRSFFFLILLTFVFSYVLSHAVDALRSSALPNRSTRVVLVSSFFAFILVLVGTLIVPLIREQASVIAHSYPTYLSAVDNKLVELSDQYSPLKDFIESETRVLNQEKSAEQLKAESPTLVLISWLIDADQANGTGDMVQSTAQIMRRIGSKLIALGSTFFLSLLFSFLIVLDLPALKKGTESLAHTKLAFIYEECAGSIRTFAKVLGRALEAQFIIACINTTLTAILIWYLGLGSKLAFLSTIVFICGFIPVAGVFISSVPICLFALTTVGFSALFVTAMVIWMIHLFEAYVLNPKIFGYRLRMNPVIVLIILTIGGKLFHFWGLVLGLPVVTYLFRYAIQRGPLEQDD